MTDDEVTWDDVEAFARGLGDEYRIMWAIKDPPSEAMIAEAEEELDAKFPAEYRAFLARFGALYLDVDEATWRRPAPYEVRPSWQMGHGRIVAGVAAKLHPDLSVTARSEQMQERGADTGFVCVLGEVVGSEAWIGYDADGNLVEWSHDGVEELGGTLASHVLASLRRLAEDRERLRTEPIGPAPEKIEHERSYTLCLIGDHDRDARLAAVEAAVASLRAAHQVRLAIELIGDDDDGNARVAAHELTLADLVDDEDALARLYVDDVEVQITVEEPFDDTGIEVSVGVLGDPRELAAGAAAHAAFERELAARGPIRKITRNWESWKS